jgi:hypothetical protein
MCAQHVLTTHLTFTLHTRNPHASTTENQTLKRIKMSGSSFGKLFKVTTFGESHCYGVGAIVDGVPPRMDLSEEDIQTQLTRRRPGQSALSTPRNEEDQVHTARSPL